jgi:hypothetical protein
MFAKSASLIALIFLCFSPSAFSDVQPTQWEQLFFPFPIVGAPPQLEQQIQLFGSYFSGNSGSGVQPSLELSYIASPHLGIVADAPYQFGNSGQPSGIGDSSLLFQYLVGGSLANDNMISAGVQTTFPTGVPGISNRDFFLGPFVYGAQRLWKHLIFEGNGTALFPIEHKSTAEEILINGMVSYLTTKPDASFPVYIQTEIDTTFYISGTSGLPPQASAAPDRTVFLAPEIFLGPFQSTISDGTRIAAGVFFELAGDLTHQRTYTLTMSFDIPNKYGY